MAIHKKLFNLKSEIGKISKDSSNPFFKSKYFDINSLLEHCEPLLKKNELLLTQPILDGKVLSIITDIESGEKEVSELELPNLSDPQKLGSAITYYRRYTLQSLLGLQAEDDDGNKASGNTGASKPQEEQKPWLNIYVKGTKELTEEMTGVSEKMRDGTYSNINDIRKDYAVNKANAATLEAWFVKLNQKQTA